MTSELKTIVRHLAGLLLALLLALVPNSLAAQTATADWGNAGAGNLAAMPNPTNITASDNTSVQMNYSSVTNGGTFVPVYGNSFVSYYSGTLGGTSSVLLLSFDNSNYDPADKVTTEITLGRNVTNLAFSITDIDSGGFADAFEVYYDNGNGTFQNAATNTAFWTGNSTVLRTNNATLNGWRGNGASDTTATNGDLSFNFGTTTVKRIRIVYFSYTGIGDPGAQLAGVSGLRFAANPNYADLSLTKALIGGNPASGGSVTWRLSVNNATASTLTATGVQVQDYLPAGFTFVSSSGTGTFNGSSGLWTVGSIAPGVTRVMDITGIANVSSGTTITNTAEITASSVPDLDSIVGNGVTTEDDYAAASFTTTGGRTAGIAPALSCPAGSVLFDWDTRTWTEGSTNNTYALDTIGSLTFNLANPGTWLGGTTFGGQSPNRQTIMNGGTLPAENTVVQFVDLPSRTAEVTTTITLPAVMSGAQFKLFDVDFGANQFADRVTVIGKLNGANVLPVLTNGIANYVSGNSAYGDGVANSDSANGNVTATFSSNIDTIVITYGNHSAAPTDPGQQAMALHDITFCRPTTTITAAKSSTIISDPINGTTNPKAIPGATVRYCITLTNAGAAAASNVIAADILPTGFTYTAETIRSGTTCANATTVEDDNNTGADESDPVGASLNASTISMNAATLAAASTIAFTFGGTIN